MPTLDEWIVMADAERAGVLARLNPYAGEGVELIEAIAQRFRNEFESIPGLRITGAGVYHGGSWVIGTTRPLIFDRRRVPDRYLGIEIRASVYGELPPEFDSDQVWAPENYERYVDRCGATIATALGNSEMTRQEMLHALVGMPFQQYLDLYGRGKRT